jgi:hypothetical protein
MAPPWREVPGGVDLPVRLTPRSGAARIDGVVEAGGQTCLKVRVPAPPVNGAANRALIAFLADVLDLPRSNVALVSGEHARIKRLRLTGDGLSDRLTALAG